MPLKPYGNSGPTITVWQLIGIWIAGFAGIVAFSFALIYALIGLGVIVPS